MTYAVVFASCDESGNDSGIALRGRIGIYEFGFDRDTTAHSNLLGRRDDLLENRVAPRVVNVPNISLDPYPAWNRDPLDFRPRRRRADRPAAGFPGNRCQIAWVLPK